jgi:thiamine transport system permease protein
MTRPLPGIIALAAISLLIGGAFAGLAVEAARDWSGAVSAFDASMLRIAGFTLWQAALSTLLSVLPAILVARAFSRHPSFPGRAPLLRVFAVPLGLPAIVAALGLLALYGRAGFVADSFNAAGAGRWPGIYGLSGILIAHVFFNLPLATRLLLAALETVPPDQWRIGNQLGMTPATTFRLIEWPALRRSIAGVATLVFMLCVTSFTLVLTLGGGPAATTLEVAIYQSLRFDFEPARAVALTVVQVAITIAMVVALSRLGANTTGDANLPIAGRRIADAGRGEALFNAALLGLAAVFVAGPMAAVVASGLDADLGRLATEQAVLAATGTSLVLAFGSALLSVALSLALVSTRRALESSRKSSRPSMLDRLTDSGASLVLVVPPIVIGAGWFILLRNTGSVFAVAPVMVVAVNAVMAMPFAVRAIRPAYDAASVRNDRLCAQLGISGLARARLIDWPELRRPLATGFAFAMALSLGDLGVIALFGSESVQTLPYLLYSRMGSYRTADAAGLALLLGILCFALMSLADRLGRNAR